MIRVQLFASLKDAAGQSSVEVPSSTQMTVEEIYGFLQKKFPALENFRSVVLPAVNEEYADWETLIGPDDEVAFFPPVSGGAS